MNYLEVTMAAMAIMVNLREGILKVGIYCWEFEIEGGFLR